MTELAHSHGNPNETPVVDAMLASLDVSADMDVTQARMNKIVDDHINGRINSQEYTAAIEALEYHLAEDKGKQEQHVETINARRPSLLRRLARSITK